MKKPALIILFIFLAGLALYGIAQDKISSPSDSLIFKMAESNLSDTSWGNPVNTTQQTPLGTFSGQEMTGMTTTSSPMITHFENVKELSKMGYKANQNLSADGPGSSQWGYSKDADGTTQIIIYSYKTAPTSNNPDEPLQFNCPCSTTVSVFVSTPQKMEQSNKNTTSLANPASVNCAQVGGTTVIKNGPNGQYGLCEFEDNMACEEWALYRGDCPVGGVKTTGYDNISQMYCAWVGGKTLAVANPNCELPNGTVCTDEAVYNGTCVTN